MLISFFHAEQAGLLPGHHRDPLDRMLVAQAQAEGLVIVTADPKLAPLWRANARCREVTDWVHVPPSTYGGGVGKTIAAMKKESGLFFC